MKSEDEHIATGLSDEDIDNDTVTDSYGNDDKVLEFIGKDGISWQSYLSSKLK